ncbi:hypothetical protein BDV36DRAFT_18486 [Aspergillus pseudocaelatus]|uniref:Secreted protein n=1 Tax=Aspergillus pseudocaelatus TaxID=1825620 RepID=A0ABQ6WXU9_9EURO|nr:hypothetical protein BDV36DRAFT_18486 [Aspergillus pseudocaelatus]
MKLSCGSFLSVWVAFATTVPLRKGCWGMLRPFLWFSNFEMTFGWFCEHTFPFELPFFIFIFYFLFIPKYFCFCG